MRKLILTFLAGVLCACALLFFLIRTPYSSDPAPVVAVVAAPAQVAAVAPLAAAPVAAAVTALPVLVEPAPAPAAAAVPLSVPAPGRLLVPVEGVTPAQLSDTFNQARGTERRHEALDILAPKGSKVLAVADGKVVKLFNSKPGGLTVYQFDVSEKYAYYYAHLDAYASGVTEGSVLKRGDLVGYVGTTGNADPAAPHLHFAIFELEPAKQWWKGAPLNPYPLLRPAP